MIRGSSRAELESKGNKAMQEADKWTKEAKIRISPEKSQVIVFGATFQRQPIIKSEGQTIPAKNTAEYLGVILDSKLNFYAHIIKTMSKANSAMQKVLTLARKHEVKPERLVTYYKTIFLGIATYRCQDFAGAFERVHIQKKAQTAQRKVPRRLTCAYNKTPTETLQVIALIPPIDLEIRAAAAKMWLKQDPNKAREVLNVEGEINKAVIEKWIDTNWSERWQSCPKGSHARSIVRNIEERRKMEFIPNREFTRLISGHGPYNAYLKRFNPDKDSKCWNCGREEDALHVLKCHPEFKELKLGTDNDEETIKNVRNILKNMQTAKELGRSLAEYEQRRRSEELHDRQLP